jgi:hypothetical protein
MLDASGHPSSAYEAVPVKKAGEWRFDPADGRSSVGVAL